MRILHLCWSLTNGGMENMLVDIINCQLRQADVSLLVINNCIDKSIIERLDKRCHLKTLGRKEGCRNPFVLLRINGYLMTLHFDIVHLHNADMIKYLWVRRNYIRTVHNTNISYHNYRWHKGIIAISNAVHEDLENRGVLGSVVIDNGVNFKLIRHCKKSSRDKIFRIVQVSRILFEQKGQDILVEALYQLKENGFSNFHLDFIGTGVDEQGLKDMIVAKKLEGNVTMLGDKPREYIYKNLCSYDLFVQPSRFEGFGLTVAEAMGAKIPVLVSENEGPLAIIDNGKYGFSFKNKSIPDCAIQIKNVVDNYPSEEYIEAAYRHVVSKYNIEVTAQKYLTCYQDLLKR